MDTPYLVKPDFSCFFRLDAGNEPMVVHSLTSTGFQQTFNTLVSQGYRHIKVSVYEDNKALRYAAIFDKVPNSAGWILYHGMSSAVYQQKFNEYAAPGYYPVAVSAEEFPGKPVFVALWEKLPAVAYRATHDVTQAILQSIEASSGALGLYPVSVEAYTEAAEFVAPEVTVDRPQIGVPVDEFADLEAALMKYVQDRDITVEHLLDHRGGWDRERSGDPMFATINIARILGVGSPPSQEEYVRYMLGRAMNFAPVERFAYSNFGYLVLGLIAEKVTGEDLTDLVRGRILMPAGVPDSDFDLGRSLVHERNPREPWYSDPGMGINIFDTTEEVLFPDGAMHVEAFETHGGFICTAEAYARFMDYYGLNGDPTENGTVGVFYGSMPGTTSVAVQRDDGTNFVGFFNQRRDPGGEDYFEMDDILRYLHHRQETCPTVDVTTVAMPELQTMIDLRPDRLILS